MIKKDCKWYSKKFFSIGGFDYCCLYDEELLENANDCELTECENYKKKVSNKK